MIWPRMCPVCTRRTAVAFQPCCNPCYQPMPAPMRTELWIAWRARVTNPARYHEVLLAVLQWHRDRRREGGEA